MKMKLGIAVLPRVFEPNFIALPKVHSFILNRLSLPLQRGCAESCTERKKRSATNTIIALSSWLAAAIPGIVL